MLTLTARFYVQSALELNAQQPVVNEFGSWNRQEYRPLEGFVYAVSPFNFTALGTNLAFSPALMGNVVLWKPSHYSLHASWLLYNIFLEAGLPRDVVQWVPGDAEMVTRVCLAHEEFAGLNFTGSTKVFKSLLGKIGQGTADDIYRQYPRVVGETGGKNFHLIHSSADIDNAVNQTIRGAFEYQGQNALRLRASMFRSPPGPSSSRRSLRGRRNSRSESQSNTTISSTRSSTRRPLTVWRP